MEKTVLVKAKEGTQCPREKNPRTYISDGQAVPVSLTPYYRRRIKDGSLVEEKGQAKKPVVKKDKGGKN